MSFRSVTCTTERLLGIAESWKNAIPQIKKARSMRSLPTGMRRVCKHQCFRVCILILFFYAEYFDGVESEHAYCAGHY